jgi:hypothetical protein
LLASILPAVVSQTAYAAMFGIAAITPSRPPSTPLIMGAEHITALHDLRERAAAAPVHLPDRMERSKTPEGLREHAAAMSRLTITIPIGFLVTYSIETGHPGGGSARHLTMSTAREMPPPTVAQMKAVARELGFVGDISCANVWSERACPVHCDQGRDVTINLIQTVEGGPDG